MRSIGEARAKAILKAPFNSINLSEWLFTLSAEDYDACAEGHQSASQGILPSGKRVSTNSEIVGSYFMIQHYVEEISKADRVLVVSPNTVLWLDDKRYVILEITWELFLEKLDSESCILHCRVHSATDNEAFLSLSKANNAQYEEGESPFQLHINEETPLFAQDIQRKALAGLWN